MPSKKVLMFAVATAGSLVAAAASAQNFDRQTTTEIPSGTPADILTTPPPVPLAGAVVGGALGLATLPLAPFEGRSTYVAPTPAYGRSVYSDDIYGR